jgi:hypothetical protein
MELYLSGTFAFQGAHLGKCRSEEHMLASRCAPTSNGILLVRWSCGAITKLV